ncbi:hypothetical protein C5167_007100 [Papaver somniferum]|uniref:SKP1-like protein n=1 Tax=Papaver somniferum TaxID=3469 RepID=A0A4Y7JJ66_PAPSO|nr:SKP1-like protein 11 [Papaver somniferum]RZC59799.1 hypothetical protein C5167_007100 [Papaver somniferum]
MSPPNTIITLKSSDGQTFDIQEAIVLQSRTLTTIVANNYGKTNIVIPVNNVRGKILANVIEYCTKHAENEYYCNDDEEEETKNWDAEFANVDAKVMRELMKASSLLNIPDLVDLLLWKMADMMHGKTLEEIHILFPAGMFAKTVVEEEEEDYWDSEWDFD